MPHEGTGLEQARERREARRSLLAHGEGVRHAVGKLRDPSLIEAVEGTISTKLAEHAVALGLVEPFTSDLEPRHVEEVERVLGEKFVREVRREVQGTAREQHLQGDVSERRLPSFEPSYLPRRDGPYSGRSCGFNTGSVLGAAPESLTASLWTRWRRQLLSPLAHREADDKLTVRIIHVGAGRGALASMIDADASVEFETFVTEVEAWRGARTVVSIRARRRQQDGRQRNVEALEELRQQGIDSDLEDPADATGEPAYSSLVARLYEVPTGRHQFDFAFYQFPAPALGPAAQLRNVYKSVDEVSDGNELVPQGERRVFDLGRLGPKKWTRTVAAEIQKLPTLMKPRSEVAILAPGAVCEFPERGSTREPAAIYRPLPSLYEAVAEAIRAAGLNILRVLDVEERAPERQPFVGRRRPPQRLWLTRVS